jgi:hypothetical protein
MTAVEWLEEQMKDDRFLAAFEDELKQAKEMEKKQIIQARLTAPPININEKFSFKKEAEEYYNETFNKI